MSDASRYTETDPALQAIYNEAQDWQYTHAELVAMPVDHLVYLSGHRPPMHTEITDEGKRIKLQGNAYRAQDELQRRLLRDTLQANRRLVLATWVLSIATIVGAVLVVVLGE